MKKYAPLQILLAEDNLVNQKVTLYMLDRLGYRADVVANGLEVLEALDQVPYDVILMDINMPKMDGLEATRRVVGASRSPVRPYIIALTANVIDGDPEQCIKAGMDDYLNKPVYPAELQEALRKAVAARDRKAIPYRTAHDLGTKRRGGETGNWGKDETERG